MADFCDWEPVQPTDEDDIGRAYGGDQFDALRDLVRAMTCRSGWARCLVAPFLESQTR
jgi:hypothetical protein